MMTFNYIKSDHITFLTRIINDMIEEVRFEKEPKLPQFGSRVNFEGLEACEVNNRVYFRAKSIRKVG